MTVVGRDSRRGTVWLWVAVAGILVGTVDGARQIVSSGSGNGGDQAFLALAPLFAILGLLIALKQPGNRIGVLLISIGGGLAIEAIVGAVLTVLNGGILDMTTRPAVLTPVLWVRLWINNWSWVAAIFPILLLLYVFPTGALPSRRWVWAPRLMAAMAAMMLFISAFTSNMGPFSEVWLMTNPIGFVAQSVIDVILIPWSACLFALACGGVGAMIVRYRRSAYTQKTQIKWVLLSVGFFGVVYGFTVVFTSWTDQFSVLNILLPLSVATIPISITIAILKYQLFDIDLIISRSLVYGALALFIGVVYVGIVVGIGNRLDRGGNAGFGLSIAATSLVALAFQPVRVRVERLANRVVYGERATPYEVLAQFSRGSAEESDEELLARIPRLLVDGTGASTATLWVRSGDQFRAASTWPDRSEPRLVPADDAFVDPAADYSMPVLHDGELLGGISLTTPRGDSITPTEEELLSNLAGGMGLAMRNTQLTSQLRQQVKDLRRSRDRIVSAADQARRSLEHDLDSGPQQHLVAVKVRLGATRLLAEKAGAEKTAALLADIESQAGDAIQAVREFAGGIYPPLLGAEGLGVALGHQVQRAALPISVHAEGIGRYPRDVESAVYFSVLEALQNTAKYADATSADVILVEKNGDLVFEVKDDGVGFDISQVKAGAGLNGIADRIDTVGGSWRITSRPGSGTVVSGLVPVRESVLA